MPKYRIISEGEALVLLSPHAMQLRECVQAAWTHYVREVAPVVALPSSRTRANIMHDLIINEFRKRWGDAVIVARGRHVLRLEKDVLIQAKKLDRDRLPMNYPTDGAVSWAGQQSFADVPPATRLTLGYTLNEMKTELVDITVLCQRSFRSVSWYYDLMDLAAPIKQLQLPVQEPKSKRLKPKSGNRKPGKSEGSTE